MSPLEFVIKPSSKIFKLMILARTLGELGLKHARVDIDTIEEHDSENVICVGIFSVWF